MNVALSDRSHLGRDVGNKCADAHRTYTRRPSCRLCTCGGMYNSIVFAGSTVGLNISSQNSIHIHRQKGEEFPQREGVYVATGSRDNTIKLWDARSGQLISTLVSAI